ncbi:MAG: hypothetical protein II880_03595 [Schwartzia sp.]|nr:hypothetical protein [Schwartzia sp. (in: firmicutes)]
MAQRIRFVPVDEMGFIILKRLAGLNQGGTAKSIFRPDGGKTSVGAFLCFVKGKAL